MVGPAADGGPELAAPVLVHPLKVNAVDSGELEQRAAAVLLVGPRGRSTAVTRSTSEEEDCSCLCCSAW